MHVACDTLAVLTLVCVSRMFTKLAMIEEALKKKRQTEENANQQDQGTNCIHTYALLEIMQYVGLECDIPVCLSLFTFIGKP